MEEVKSPMVRIQLPLCYGCDAYERLDYSCYEGMRTIRETKSFIELDLPIAGLIDLYDDALYYASPKGPDGITSGHRRSARIAVQRIEGKLTEETIIEMIKHVEPDHEISQSAINQALQIGKNND